MSNKTRTTPGSNISHLSGRNANFAPQSSANASNRHVPVAARKQQQDNTRFGLASRNLATQPIPSSELQNVLVLTFAKKAKPKELEVRIALRDFLKRLNIVFREKRPGVYTTRAPEVFLIALAQDSKSLFDDLCGQELVVDGLKGLFSDPRAPKLHVVRVKWVRPGVDTGKVRSFLAQQGVPNANIITVERECVSSTDPDFMHLESSTVCAKIAAFDRDTACFHKLRGVKKLDNFDVFITRVGDGKFCLFCNVNGHHKKDCNLLKQEREATCSKCNKQGHSEAKCRRYAAALAHNGDELSAGDEDEDEAHMFGEESEGDEGNTTVVVVSATANASSTSGTGGAGGMLVLGSSSQVKQGEERLTSRAASSIAEGGLASSSGSQEKTPLAILANPSATPSKTHEQLRSHFNENTSADSVSNQSGTFSRKSSKRTNTGSPQLDMGDP